MALQLSSPAFGSGERIPEQYTCEGDDMSPPLQWSGAPPGTRSFAILCDDPDAPGGTFHHWALFDLPAVQTEIHDGYATEAHVAEVGPAVAIGSVRTVRQATNDFGNAFWGGPCPPPGHGTHHYHFRLLALDVERLDVGAAPDCAAVAAAARPHVLEAAELVGTYSR